MSDNLLQQFPSSELIVLGDFNAHHADWLGSRVTDYAGRTVFDFALSNGLTQLVSSPTRIPDIDDHNPSLLDLLLTTHPENYQAACRRVWHFKSADWDELRTFYASYPWGRVCFSSDDPNTCADSVADVILQGMELFIPSSVVPVGGRTKPWFNRSCIKASHCKQERFQAWHQAQALSDPSVKSLKKKYNSASRAYKKEIAMAKANYIKRLGQRLARLPSGTRAFWSLSKAIQNNFSRSSFPPMRKGDNALAHSAKDKADLLCSIFAANSNLDDRGTVPPSIPSCDTTMSEIRFTQRAVRKALLSLDTAKAILSRVATSVEGMSH
ncbi:unnamed protein product [Colias eurytheme]|nr:unnamed protein product [Colias eurytheme]